MKDMKIKVRMEITATQEDVDDIVSIALEGGINYWCGKAEVVGEYLGEFASEQISRGGTLKLYDKGTDDVYELDRDKLLKGIKMYIEDPESPHKIVVSTTGRYKAYVLDCYMVDAVVADMIIQYALFEKILYE